MNIHIIIKINVMMLGGEIERGRERSKDTTAPVVSYNQSEANQVQVHYSAKYK